MIGIHRRILFVRVTLFPRVLVAEGEYWSKRDGARDGVRREVEALKTGWDPLDGRGRAAAALSRSAWRAGRRRRADRADRAAGRLDGGSAHACAGRGGLVLLRERGRDCSRRGGDGGIWRGRGSIWRRGCRCRCGCRGVGIRVGASTAVDEPKDASADVPIQVGGDAESPPTSITGVGWGSRSRSGSDDLEMTQSR